MVVSKKMTLPVRYFNLKLSTCAATICAVKTSAVDQTLLQPGIKPKASRLEIMIHTTSPQTYEAKNPKKIGVPVKRHLSNLALST